MIGETNDLGGGHSAVELDASTGRFVHDTGTSSPGNGSGTQNPQGQESMAFSPDLMSTASA